MTGLKPLLCSLIVWGLLMGCAEESSPDLVRQAVAMESSDECHLCGMLITRYPGPKGQLYSKGDDQVLRFCSTRDLFAFILDPEHQHNIQEVFVHNMAVTPWDHPDEQSYVDARRAFYVIGHNKRGAMGPTIASFSQRADAERFVGAQGGEVLSFAEITLQVLLDMNTRP